MSTSYSNKMFTSYLLRLFVPAAQKDSSLFKVTYCPHDSASNRGVEHYVSKSRPCFIFCIVLLRPWRFSLQAQQDNYIVRSVTLIISPCISLNICHTQGYYDKSCRYWLFNMHQFSHDEPFLEEGAKGNM